MLEVAGREHDVRPGLLEQREQDLKVFFTDGAFADLTSSVEWEV